MAAQEETQEDLNAFHRKYRPQTLEKLIGHKSAVTQLKGMIETGRLPSAILFTGPTSVGKTTIARAFAHAVNGKPAMQQMDYKEINAGTQRGIDEMRDLERLSKLRPMGKRRFIVIDEAQQLLSNKVAAMSLLKPLEEPSKHMTWILCTMDPTKFSMGDGKAMANRCQTFVLQPHTEADLLKQAKRIAKGEKMKFVMDDEDKLLTEVVNASGGEMRTLAQLMDSLNNYWHGLDKGERPKRLKKSDIAEVLESSQQADDTLAIKVVMGVYTGKYKQVVRALLDVQEGFQFINKLLWMNSFLLNVAVLDGQRHRKVWWSPSNKELHKQVNAMGKDGPSLGVLAALNATLVEVKAQASMFQTTPEELLSAKLYHAIKTIHSK